jgi:PAS domain S-box-containing protein
MKKLPLIELREERRQRKIAEDLLLGSEEHYRALTQNTPDVIMRFDRNYRHLFVNNAIYDQLSIKPEEFINKTHHEMGIFDPGLCDFWEGQILKVFETQKPHEVEFTLPAKTGFVYIEWSLIPWERYVQSLL